MISICLAVRDEELLNWTIENVRHSTAEPVEIVVTLDGDQHIKQTPVDGVAYYSPWCLPMGTQRAKHQAILNAAADVVIVLDAHCRPEAEALDRMAATIRADRTLVACCCCGAIDDGLVTRNGQIHYGAEMKALHEGRPLTPVWCADHTPGPRGCIMGGCYAFDRERYRDTLKAPWQYGTGWGCDEETLSVHNWLHGGESVCVDAIVWHVFRKASPWMMRPEEPAGVWANKLRLLNTLGAADMVEQFWQVCPCPRGNVERLAHVPDAFGFTRTFSEYKERWVR